MIYPTNGMSVEEAEKHTNALKARGPEGTRVKQISDNVIFGFTRLAINGLTENGMQPFSNGPIHWICNGEIYNAPRLNEVLGIVDAKSDCECLGALYLRHRDDPTTFIRALDGVFAFVLYDSERDLVLVGRDPYGVRPLFVTNDIDGHRVFASEIKALSFSDQITPVLPGTLQIWNAKYNLGRVAKDKIQYHTIPWVLNPNLDAQRAEESIRFTLEEAVHKRMMTERPVAALLSGGLDSSLIAALVQKCLNQFGKPPLKTFSIGFAGSQDLAHARLVADWIKSDHTEIIMTPDEFFAAIPEVIEAIESFDTTTVRASVGNYLIAKKIRETTECKVVFNGDGSDELFGGYLYFNNAPGDHEFHAESARLLKDIHYFDVLRSDRSISANGLEARTPFLDKQFVALVRSIDPTLLRPKPGGQVEKEILRLAFDDGNTLPLKVLWRRKEAFSDGVSSPEKAWFEEIQERVTWIVPVDWADKANEYIHLRPQTAEEYYYRTLFENKFGKYACYATVPYRWMPRWCPETSDPSARTLNVYATPST
jgi:asparagine synthase (glutamine-hydrolysing)